MSVKEKKPRLPKKLGTCEIRSAIASGNMGWVYEGFDHGSERVVAIKISRSVEHQPELADRYAALFSREAQIASMLHHPNILEVYDSGKEGQYHYILFELVRDAQTLKDWLQAHPTPSLEQTLGWILQVLRGMAYAHRKGIIHRDLKPANLLLTQTGKIKIADFSIALSRHTDSAPENLSGFVGSPRYMSPEQVQDDQITEQTDLFSIGIIFYELLTGHHPFDAKSFSRLIYKLVNSAPESPQSIKAELPDALCEIVLKMLAKDPAQRYASAEAIIEAIESLSLASQQPAEQVQQTRVDQAQTLAFFQDWSATALSDLMRYAPWEQALPGTRIGLQPDQFLIVLEGEVALIQQMSDQQQVVMRKAGELCGEQAFLCDSENTASKDKTVCEAKAHVQFLRISLTALADMPDSLEKRIYHALARYLAIRATN